MKAAWLKSLVVFGVSLVAAVQARAQPLYPHAQSIESTVANADLVFIAKLEKFDVSEPANVPNAHKGHNTTIAVEETLKQDIFKDEPYRRLQMHIPRPAAVLADWQERSCPLLVAYDEYNPKATTVIELVEGNLEVLTSEFTLLCKPEAVIQAAREASQRTPASVKRIQTFGLQVPRKVIAGTAWEEYYDAAGYLVLHVPVDKQLEKRALRYIRSKSTPRRIEGLGALRYFKSDKNIALVTTFLEDLKSYELQQAQEGKQAWDYGVKDEAKQTLKSWGVDVDQSP